MTSGGAETLLRKFSKSNTPSCACRGRETFSVSTHDFNSPSDTHTQLESCVLLTAQISMEAQFRAGSILKIFAAAPRMGAGVCYAETIGLPAFIYAVKGRLRGGRLADRRGIPKGRK